MCRSSLHNTAQSFNTVRIDSESKAQHVPKLLGFQYDSPTCLNDLVFVAAARDSPRSQFVYRCVSCNYAEAYSKSDIRNKIPQQLKRQLTYAPL